MKKLFVSLALVLSSGFAFASCGNGGGAPSNGCNDSGTTVQQPVYNGGSGGHGIGVGVGIGQGGNGGNASAYGGEGGYANSVANGGSSYAQGGNGTGGYANGGQASATGNGAGNTTTLNVAAPSMPANTAYAPEVPTVAKSCRLFIGGGVTNRDGSGSGLVPIGNDQTCLSVTSVQLMIEVNSAARKHGQAAPFNTKDILSAACKIEGMKETIAACQ